MYVIWSHQHGQWWAPAGRGYVDDLADAGDYTDRDAGLYMVDDVLHNEIAILRTTAEKRGHPKFHPYNGEVS
jgi:hypothetical protein